LNPIVTSKLKLHSPACNINKRLQTNGLRGENKLARFKTIFDAMFQQFE
jgi:hypothetical protein